jgi:hypothetical protein
VCFKPGDKIIYFGETYTFKSFIGDNYSILITEESDSMSYTSYFLPRIYYMLLNVDYENYSQMNIILKGIKR